MADATLPTPVTTISQNDISAQNGITPVSQSMSFPDGLSTQDFWISMSFFEYQRPTFAGNPILTQSGGTGTIRLPLPNQMIDSQRVTYGEESLSAAIGAGINQYSGGRAGTADLSSLAATAGAASFGALTGGAANLANFAGGPNAAAAVGQLAGVALNPWLTVMFKSPAYRQYSMTWRLSATNPGESATINNIINTIKFNMLPDSSDAIGGTLLTYPNIVQITASQASTGFWNYLFKPAVIENFSVNYAPSGQPSFFNNTNAPTDVEITIQFHEIEFFLQRDYGNQQNGGLAAIGVVNGISNALTGIGNNLQQQYTNPPTITTTTDTLG